MPDEGIEQAFDLIAAWMVLEVKWAVIEGTGDLAQEEWFDDYRAETEEHLDERGLFETARAGLVDASRGM